MLVIPRRYERLQQAERCKYLIGVQITEISDEDRKRYLRFIAPEEARNFPALKKEVEPEDVRSLPGIQKEIGPETEVSYAPIEQEPTREGTSWATWWRELAWKPIYQIIEISDEDRRRYLRLIAPEVVRTFPALQKQIAPENGRSLPAIQKEIAPELEVDYALVEQEPTRRGRAWKPNYSAPNVAIRIDLCSGAGVQVQ